MADNIASSAVEILRRLVRIPSQSVLSNRPIVEVAKDLLQQAGWRCEEFPYRDSSGVEKINLIGQSFEAVTSSGTVPVDLAFVCHTDTVPPSDTWRNATDLVTNAGFLYGCGACDVKGSLAGILAAITGSAASLPPPSKKAIALVLTADEEIGCIGASQLLANHAISARQVIVCEPTSLRPGVAGKGYGLAKVSVAGREAHSAFPELGRSAISAAARMIAAIEDLAAAAATTHPLFDPPHTTFNVGTIQGGTAKNIIARTCEFLVEWRPVPNEDPGLGGSEISKLAARLSTADPAIDYEVEILRVDPGFDSAQASPLSQWLESHLGTALTGISFGSEATRFASVAGEVVVIGPGDMQTAHSDRECISIAELERWTQCVRLLLQ